MMLLSDYAAWEHFSGGEVVLVDIDEAGLGLMEEAAVRMAAVAASSVKVAAMVDVAKALRGGVRDRVNRRSAAGGVGGWSGRCR